jgi:uncharacterized protein YjbI with pentapeptide repeats
VLLENTSDIQRDAMILFASVKFASVKFARVEFARVEFARAKFARAKFARVEFARVEFARVEFARVEFASTASVLFAPTRPAHVKYASSNSNACANCSSFRVASMHKKQAVACA